MRPLLLDLFCGAGGAAMGYHRAGFDVVGVDIKPQPGYPFPFHRAGAIGFLADAVDAYMPMNGYWGAIHASPPCQRFSTTAALHDEEYPDLITPLRPLLELAASEGVPCVIENVVGAPLENPVMLCGSSFGLGVRRHRLFECIGFDIGLVPPCAHYLQPEPIDVTGTGGRRINERTSATKGGNSRKPRNLTEAREAMGIDWMTRKELAEAIPPAYTEFIGNQLISQIR